MIIISYYHGLGRLRLIALQCDTVARTKALLDGDHRTFAGEAFLRRR